MAAVYAATHRNGRRGAVKLLHPELSIDQDTRQRFLREGYVANAVGHEGAVEVLDDDTTDDGLVFSCCSKNALCQPDARRPPF